MRLGPVVWGLGVGAHVDPGGTIRAEVKIIRNARRDATRPQSSEIATARHAVCMSTCIIVCDYVNV